jgi:hypothetical protein
VRNLDTKFSRLAVPDSWAALQHWVNHYESDPVVQSVVDDILRSSQISKRLRDALLIHLWLWRRRNWITAALHSRFLTTMKGS